MFRGSYANSVSETHEFALDDLADAAVRDSPIFKAWSDEPWVIDGAAVRVSLVCFSRQDDAPGPERRLDGRPVDEVHADLTASRGGAGIDLTGARRLHRNAGVAFMGDTKGGPFDVRGEQARDWLREPVNPNGRPNSDVLRPWMNGMDVTRRPADKWIVDFGWSMVREEAALYDAPYRHAREHVHPMRQRNRRESYRTGWWRHMEPRQGMRRTIQGSRATSRRRAWRNTGCSSGSSPESARTAN